MSSLRRSPRSVQWRWRVRLAGLAGPTEQEQAAVFYTTLFGTVFSDPTVEQFELSILGNSCPVMIGESEWCFPIGWDDFTASLG